MKQMIRGTPLAVLRFSKEVPMKAVVFHGIGDIRLETVREPKIKEPTDALLRRAPTHPPAASAEPTPTVSWAMLARWESPPT